MTAILGELIVMPYKTEVMIMLELDIPKCYIKLTNNSEK